MAMKKQGAPEPGKYGMTEPDPRPSGMNKPAVMPRNSAVGNGLSSGPVKGNAPEPVPMGGKVGSKPNSGTAPEPMPGKRQMANQRRAAGIDRNKNAMTEARQNAKQNWGNWSQKRRDAYKANQAKRRSGIAQRKSAMAGGSQGFGVTPEPMPSGVSKVGYGANKGAGFQGNATVSEPANSEGFGGDLASKKKM